MWHSIWITLYIQLKRNYMRCVVRSHSGNKFRCYSRWNTLLFVIRSLANARHCRHDATRVPPCVRVATILFRWFRARDIEQNQPLPSAKREQWEPVFFSFPNEKQHCRARIIFHRHSNCQQHVRHYDLSRATRTAHVLSKCQTNVKRNVRFLLRIGRVQQKQFDIIDSDPISLPVRWVLSKHPSLSRRKIAKVVPHLFIRVSNENF